MSLTTYTPLVSVIVPTYNCEHYIREALTSLIGQTYRHLEILVVDDGSHDGSLASMLAFAAQDRRIRIISHANKGVSGARNAALDAASGEFIMFLDSDDTFKVEAVEKLVAAMLARDTSETAIDLALMGRHSVAAGRSLPKNDGDFIDRLPYGATSLTAKLLAALPFAVQHYIYRRATLTRHHIRFLEGVLNEDVGFGDKCLLVSQRISVVHERLFNYRLLANSITAELDQHRERHIESLLANLLEVLAWLRNVPESERNQALIRPLLEVRTDVIFTKLAALPKEMHDALSERICRELSTEPMLKRMLPVRYGFGGLRIDVRRTFKHEQPSVLLTVSLFGQKLFKHNSPRLSRLKVFGGER